MINDFETNIIKIVESSGIAYANNQYHNEFEEMFVYASRHYMDNGIKKSNIVFDICNSVKIPCNIKGLEWLSVFVDVIDLKLDKFYQMIADATKSYYDPDNKSVTLTIIAINKRINREKFYSLLSHELNHVKTDIGIQSNNRDNEKSKYKDLSGYFNSDKFGKLKKLYSSWMSEYQKGSYYYDVGYLIYLLFDKNGTVAEPTSVYYYLMRMKSMRRNYSRDILNSTAYNTYQWLKSYIDNTLPNINDEELWSQLMIVFSGKTSDINTFKQFFIAKCKENLNSFLKNIGRVASMFYDDAENNPSIIRELKNSAVTTPNAMTDDFSKDKKYEELVECTIMGKNRKRINKYQEKKENDARYALISEAFDEVVKEGKTINNKPILMTLSKDELNEISTDGSFDDVMNSFKIQKELNPAFWPNNRLNSRIRMRLLDIADDFFEFLDTSWVRPEDIRFVGSLAGYNWSKYSDIDLHIIIDFKKVDERVEFVKDYYDSKRKIWNDNHENLKIYGFPVEVYVQDLNEENGSAGVYSLEKNEWIKEPDRDELQDVKLNKRLIIAKSLTIAEKIEGFEKYVSKETDTQKLYEIGLKIKKLFDRIKAVRKNAIKNNGEYSYGNIIFKVLRRTGYIAKLIDLKTNIYDKMNTIK